jgi:non-heme chloroperoxidase
MAGRSADDWDTQMMFFLAKGYRVIAHDRRGHGRSTQTDTGNDMDTYAADVIELVERSTSRNAVHIGHSTGGGEVARYVAKYGRARPRRQGGADQRGAAGDGEDRGNPGGLPIEVFDGFRAALAANRAQFFLDIASGPFYGFNRPGATPSRRDRQLVAPGHDGRRQGALRLHQGVLGDRFQTEDLKAIDVPVLVMHGDRRPDRALCGLGAARGQAAQERHAQDL